MNNQVASFSQTTSNLQEQIAQLIEQLATTTTATSSTTLPTSTSTTTTTLTSSDTDRDLPVPAFSRSTTIPLQRFVAVGDNGVASYSADGTSWQVGNPTYANMKGIAFSEVSTTTTTTTTTTIPQRFVAIGNDGTSYSADGISWATSNDNQAMNARLWRRTVCRRWY